jgi:hypothetical protein
MTTVLRRRGVLMCAAWLLASVVAAGELGAQGNASADAAMRDGNAMYEAFRQGDLPRFVSYTYPGLLKALGGTKRVVELLEEGRAKMATEGFSFTAGRVGAPVTMVKAGAELHALLPLTQRLTAPGGELQVQGHLLGISADGGKSWTFIDTERLTPDNVRQVVPGFNSALALPGKATKRFVPK